MVILAGYPRNGIPLKHDDKRRPDVDLPHERSRRGQRAELGQHDRLCSGDINSSCLRNNGDSVISRCARFAFAFISNPRAASPSVGFWLFASWHGHETLTVSLVAHKSGGNIELDINMGTTQLRHHKEYSARVPAVHPAISLRHLALYRRDEKPAAVLVSDQDSRSPLKTRVEIALIAGP